MPRIRWARPSGRKASRRSRASPWPRNLIGLPVTSLMDRAAPPRASPSSLVRTNPVKSSRSSKAEAVRTASWPIIASTTNRTLSGRTARRMSATSCMRVSSMARRPAVSMITTSRPVLRAWATPCRDSWTGCMPSTWNTGTDSLRPITCSWSTAAGRYTSAATSSGRLPSASSSLASLPEVVVLPDPCSPTIRITAGSPLRSNDVSTGPIRATSSSWHALTNQSWGDRRTRCPETLIGTMSPRACSLTRARKAFATSRSTSAWSRDVRTSRRAGARFSSVSRALPCSASWAPLNPRGQHIEHVAASLAHASLPGGRLAPWSSGRAACTTEGSSMGSPRWSLKGGS